MKRILFFALAAIALTACNKEEMGDDHDHDHEHNSDPITITIATPTDNETFDYNDVVAVTGTISRTSEIHGYSVELIDETTQDVLFTDDVHAHGTDLTINKSWTNTIAATSTVLVRVTAFGNHEGTETEVATKTITCNQQ